MSKSTDSVVSEIGVSEIQEPIYLIEDAGLVGPPLVIGGKFSDDDADENIQELRETEKKREKKPRRRRSKHRKNKAFEKKEKKGLVYSRKEMEALKFEDLDGQKKKWLEVYCGLCPSVALEYDDLLHSDHNLEPTICFHFDPRPQFQKASTPPASLGMLVMASTACNSFPIHVVLLLAI